MTLGNLIVVIFGALIVLAVVLRIGSPWGVLILVLGLLALGLSAVLWGLDSRDQQDSASSRARSPER
jgi:hypothetical protein